MFTSCAQLAKYKDGVIDRTGEAVDYIEEQPITSVDWQAVIIYVLFGIGSLGTGATSYAMYKKRSNKKNSLNGVTDGISG